MDESPSNSPVKAETSTDADSASAQQRPDPTAAVLDTAPLSVAHSQKQFSLEFLASKSRAIDENLFCCFCSVFWCL